MIDAERLQQDVIEHGGKIERLIQRCIEQRSDINETRRELAELGDQKT